MGDREKAQKRFEQTAEQIDIFFRPQCSDCEKNLGIEHCTAFHQKPANYQKNEKECPERIVNK